jgi:hypothetical protein
MIGAADTKQIGYKPAVARAIAGIINHQDRVAVIAVQGAWSGIFYNYSLPKLANFFPDWVHKLG